MLASLNRWIGLLLIAIGLVIAAIGVYLGAFAWFNDGGVAGLRLFGTTAAFGAALSFGGLALRFAGAAHARRDRRRWWIQIAALIAGYVAFGLAAETTSLLDRIGRR